jgi:hypothetical protein
VRDRRLGQPEAVAPSPVDGDSVGPPGLVLRHHQEPGQVVRSRVEEVVERARHVLPDELRAGGLDLLDRPQLPPRRRGIFVTEVEVVDPDLLVELPNRVRRAREDPEDDGVLVAHEVAAHRGAGRVRPVEPRGEKEVRGPQRPGGEDEAPRAKREPAPRPAVYAADGRHAPALRLEPHGHRARPQREPAFQEARQNRRGQVVLGADRAGEGIARRAADARARSATGDRRAVAVHGRARSVAVHAGRPLQATPAGGAAGLCGRRRS